MSELAGNILTLGGLAIVFGYVLFLFIDIWVDVKKILKHLGIK